MCVAEAVVAAPPFLRVDFGRGVSGELPRNWLVISGNQRITLDAWSAAYSQRLSGEKSTSELLFAANYYDQRGNAVGVFNIRFYPDQELTQQDAIAATPEDLLEFDAAIRANITTGLDGVGGRIVDWRGTTTREVNSLLYFLTAYSRVGRDSQHFNVVLLRLLAGDKSFTVTISHREDQTRMLSEISAYIIDSIRATSVY